MTISFFDLMAISKKRSEKRKPKIENRVKTFNINENMIIVDYGCGPGMYINCFSKAVGDRGKVFAVDINENAKKYIEDITNKNNLRNVSFHLSEGYNSKIENEIADIVFALDVFHGIEDTNLFLDELYRICKKDGVLIIDDGHQKRIKTKNELEIFKKLEIIEEIKDHIKLKKK